MLTAAWRDICIPRARIRAVLRTGAARMRAHPLPAAVFWGALGGAAFVLYALGMSPGRAFLAWAVFGASGVMLGVGGPLATVHAWPAALVAVAAGAVWGCASFGMGALWLAAAACAAAMALYLAADVLVPLALAGWLGYAVGGWGGAGSIAVGTAAFIAAAAALLSFRLFFRRTLTAPLLAAVWLAASLAAAARLASMLLGDAMPAEWSANALHGPPWLAACVAAAALGGGALVWPRHTSAAEITEDDARHADRPGR